MSTQDSDNSFIRDALPAFISEAQEQTEQLEQLMLQLEDTPDDRELLDALFRCAHTVKGSAGIFGLDTVVSFTHHVESLLDRLREGRVVLTPALSTLLLRCNDEIRSLIAADAASAEGDAGAPIPPERAALIASLQAAYGDDVPAAAPAAAPAPGPRPGPGADPLSRSWLVAVRFGADTFRNGMDPLAILNYVRTLGTISALGCDALAIPALDQVDPESSISASRSTPASAAKRSSRPSASCAMTARCTSSSPSPRPRPWPT